MRPRITLIVAVFVAILIPAAAVAQVAHTPKTLRHSYLKRYHKVARTQGKRAPGKNIVNSGTAAQLRRSIRTLDNMLTPPPTTTTTASAPTTANPPTQVRSSGGSGGGGGGLAACIRQHENGGSYTGTDPSGTYGGAYQFDQQTWTAAGGSGSPATAPPAEQDRVFAHWHAIHPEAWPVSGPACGG